MVFNIGAVAGPSRLPLISRAAFNVSRRCASGKAPADDAVDAQADAEAAVEVTSDVAPQEEKGPLAPGFKSFMDNISEQYREPRKGQKALWLGGSIPFPQNPSFRPPPPLSNDLQNLIYERKLAGETLGQLSQAFGISKARIEAVMKLKDVEMQFKRQNKTLQTAFLTGMEPLLGVQSPLKDKKVDIVSSRKEQQARDEHPSGHVELAEEERFEKGVGAGGAFGMGDLMPGQQAASEETGMEGLAWEFRDEDDKGFKPTPFNRNPPIVAETGENLAQAAPVAATPAAAPTKSRVSGEFRFINSTEVSSNSAPKTNQKMHARKKQAKAKAMST